MPKFNLAPDGITVTDLGGLLPEKMRLTRLTDNRHRQYVISTIHERLLIDPAAGTIVRYPTAGQGGGLPGDGTALRLVPVGEAVVSKPWTYRVDVDDTIDEDTLDPWGEPPPDRRESGIVCSVREITFR